ncbi:cell division protein FtsK [Nonomuraea sp. 3-1Str]|uniref:FtsK/SpoIIIE domain-containing protein n=1 Tax=Nonomuraea sp. 3-1Str TaxID=2929801 RepID=UPI00286687B8|nr:FtsK/SpoIIIE domain-containing protein [Nonomuraea sp. 3-1Str]MDR8408551.1 cell division protein FtsK [Nonomuraea sp. 3-1Str]
MRIMLTVLGERGDRDIVLEGDDEATVGAVSEALDGRQPLAQVVRLPRSRAPYGLPGAEPQEASRPSWGPGHPAEPGGTLWRNGRALDPRAPARAVLRDGDKVTLEPRLARLTIIEEPGGVAEVRVVGGPAAGAVHRLGLGVHVIGSDPMCALAVADPALAPEAVVLRVTPGAITAEPIRRAAPGQAPRPKLKGRWADEVAEMTARVAEREAAAADPGSWQPPELDGRPLAGPADWPEHAVLTCGSSVFALTAIEPQDAHLDPRPEGGVAYNRPPRLRRTDGERAFERPAEPRRAEGMRLQLLAAFLPAVLGCTLAYVLHQWYFLLMALMTPVIMIGQWWSDRRHGRKQHRKALKEFQQRLREYEEVVERARARDEVTRRSDAPDPAEVLLTATGPRRRLWERRVHDPDALRLRIGLADLPADLDLTEEQGGPIDPPICRAVPVALAMRRLGVAGITGPRDAATGLAGWLVGQAATLHSPRDLAIVVLSARADGERRWGWVRWLPHCAPRGGEDCVALVGTDPESAARRVTELATLIDERQNATAPELGKIPTGWGDAGGSEKPVFSTYDERPYDVLVLLDGAQALRGLPGMPQVLRQGPRAGVYTLAIDEDQRLLPEECATAAACGTDGYVRLRGGGLDVIGPVLADLVSLIWCDRLARALSPIRDVSRDDPSGNLPSAARLLDLLGLAKPTGQAVAARWRGRGSTKATIGIGPDGPFAVDLALDGPHGLIAGTTGAGKSELLQTLICSLAVVNRPDQLTFVLIDYKGGAAFKECVRLPHTVGMVSDLDGHLTQRALDSLAAELRRRERLLLAAGAKDIEDYTGDPLPRLVLIIDEFAALVAELPDFVTGLVDIARRGRSLGIHLILATQRPAGVVTADIQANTSLRIALRVTEPMESSDIIDMPDAAHISKTTPGRCYVKSGASAATAVQTARVGGRSPLPRPRRPRHLLSAPSPGLLPDPTADDDHPIPGVQPESGTRAEPQAPHTRRGPASAPHSPGTTSSQPSHASPDAGGQPNTRSPHPRPDGRPYDATGSPTSATPTNPPPVRPHTDGRHHAPYTTRTPDDRHHPPHTTRTPDDRRHAPHTSQSPDGRPTGADAVPTTDGYGSGPHPLPDDFGGGMPKGSSAAGGPADPHAHTALPGSSRTGGAAPGTSGAGSTPTGTFGAGGAPTSTPASGSASHDPTAPGGASHGLTRPGDASRGASGSGGPSPGDRFPGLASLPRTDGLSVRRGKAPASGGRPPRTESSPPDRSGSGIPGSPPPPLTSAPGRTPPHQDPDYLGAPVFPYDGGSAFPHDPRSGDDMPPLSPRHPLAPDDGFPGELVSSGDPASAGVAGRLPGEGLGRDGLHEILNILGPADRGGPARGGDGFGPDGTGGGSVVDGTGGGSVVDGGGGGFGAADDGRGSIRVVNVDWRSLGKPLPAPPEPPEESTVTDLSILADAVVEATRLTGVRRQPSPWLEPLPTHLVLDQVHPMTGRAAPYTGLSPLPGSPETDTGQRPLTGPPQTHTGRKPLTGRADAEAGSYRSGVTEVEPIAFGVVDRPWAQDRRALALDLRQGGHLLIAGSPRTGRSTALRTIAGAIAAQASPSDVHVHAIDCGSGALLPLMAMPHCGAVVTRDQLDRVERLLGRLRAEVGRRQQLLAEAGHASLAEFRLAGHRLPWLVFMLDRWEGFVAAFESYDYGRLIDAVLQLLREGSAVGLRAVVTGDRSCLMGQVSTVFDDRLILRLADPADYGLAGLPLKGLPSSMPPGRTLSIGEHGIVESQIALLTADASGPAQVGALQDLARAVSAGVQDSPEAMTLHDLRPARPGQPAVPGQPGAGHGQPGSVDGLSGTVEPSDDGGRRRLRNAGQAAFARGAWLWEGEPPLRVDALPMRITAGEAEALDPGFSPPSPLWALVGAGGDALAPLGIDLYAQGPGAVIAGPSRSGRSSVLVTAAHSLIAYGTPVVAIAPRRSPLRDLRGAVAVLDGNATDLQELLAEHEEYVVLVDDAELISPDGPLGMALEEVLRSGRDGDHGLIIAGSTGDLTQAYRGFVAETRKSRTGVLLSVQSPADGDLLSVRLPRGAVGGPPGRGLLVTMGTMTPIQAALPEGEV